MLIVSSESRLGKKYLCLFWKKLKYIKVNNLPKSTKRPLAESETDLGFLGISRFLFHTKWPKNQNVVDDAGAKPTNPPAIPSFGEDRWWMMTNGVKLTIVNHFFFTALTAPAHVWSPALFKFIFLLSARLSGGVSRVLANKFSQVLPIVCVYNMSNDLILWRSYFRSVNSGTAPKKQLPLRVDSEDWVIFYSICGLKQVGLCSFICDIFFCCLFFFFFLFLWVGLCSCLTGCLAWGFQHWSL